MFFFWIFFSQKVGFLEMYFCIALGVLAVLAGGLDLGHRAQTSAWELASVPSRGPPVASSVALRGLAWPLVASSSRSWQLVAPRAPPCTYTLTCTHIYTKYTKYKKYIKYIR